MSDYDDMLNDYDWHQNTGELGEYFDGGGNDGGGCVAVGCLACFLVAAPLLAMLL